jgi:hypothetical protein
MSGGLRSSLRQLTKYDQIVYSKSFADTVTLNQNLEHKRRLWDVTFKRHHVQTFVTKDAAKEDRGKNAATDGTASSQ